MLRNRLEEKRQQLSQLVDLKDKNGGAINELQEEIDNYINQLSLVHKLSLQCVYRLLSTECDGNA